MENETKAQPTVASAWQVKQVYAMAVISLVVGLAIGYLFRGSQSPALSPTQPVAASQSPHAAGGMGGQMPSLEQMKQMADDKAAPLLEQLKGDPNNTVLLTKVGDLYQATHQFKEAAGYYDKALHVDPKNVSIRTAVGFVPLLRRRCRRGDHSTATGAALRSQGCQLPVQPRNDQVAGKKGQQGSACGLAVAVEIESAIERRAQSHGAETDRRHPDAE